MRAIAVLTYDANLTPSPGDAVAGDYVIYELKIAHDGDLIAAACSDKQIRLFHPEVHGTPGPLILPISLGAASDGTEHAISPPNPTPIPGARRKLPSIRSRRRPRSPGSP